MPDFWIILVKFRQDYTRILRSLCYSSTCYLDCTRPLGSFVKFYLNYSTSGCAVKCYLGYTRPLGSFATWYIVYYKYDNIAVTLIQTLVLLL